MTDRREEIERAVAVAVATVSALVLILVGLAWWLRS